MQLRIVEPELTVARTILLALRMAVPCGMCLNEYVEALDEAKAALEACQRRVHPHAVFDQFIEQTNDEFAVHIGGSMTGQIREHLFQLLAEVAEKIRDT